MAMYLMHVALGRSLTQVGNFFQRDRTTVSYACMRIEDLRDDPGFDEELGNLEEAIEFVTESETMIEQYLAGLKSDE
jgi:chromosomal replication initiation ATPase DnaA